MPRCAKEIPRPFAEYVGWPRELAICNSITATERRSIIGPVHPFGRIGMDKG